MSTNTSSFKKVAMASSFITMDHEMGSRHSSSSDELTDNPEIRLMADAHSESDLRADQRDMLRLGKKQEFKV